MIFNPHKNKSNPIVLPPSVQIDEPNLRFNRNRIDRVEWEETEVADFIETDARIFTNTLEEFRLVPNTGNPIANWDFRDQEKSKRIFHISHHRRYVLAAVRAQTLRTSLTVPKTANRGLNEIQYIRRIDATVFGEITTHSCTASFNSHEEGASAVAHRVIIGEQIGEARSAQFNPQNFADVTEEGTRFIRAVYSQEFGDEQIEATALVANPTRLDIGAGGITILPPDQFDPYNFRINNFNILAGYTRICMSSDAVWNSTFRRPRDPSPKFLRSFSGTVEQFTPTRIEFTLFGDKRVIHFDNKVQRSVSRPGTSADTPNVHKMRTNNYFQTSFQIGRMERVLSNVIIPIGQIHPLDQRQDRLQIVETNIDLIANETYRLSLNTDSERDDFSLSVAAWTPTGTSFPSGAIPIHEVFEPDQASGRRFFEFTPQENHFVIGNRLNLRFTITPADPRADTPDVSITNIRLETPHFYTHGERMARRLLDRYANGRQSLEMTVLRADKGLMLADGTKTDREYAEFEPVQTTRMLNFTFANGAVQSNIAAELGNIRKPSKISLYFSKRIDGLRYRAVLSVIENNESTIIATRSVPLNGGTVVFKTNKIVSENAIWQVQLMREFGEFNFVPQTIQLFVPTNTSVPFSEINRPEISFSRGQDVAYFPVFNYFVPPGGINNAEEEAFRVALVGIRAQENAVLIINDNNPPFSFQLTRGAWDSSISLLNPFPSRGLIRFIPNNQGFTQNDSELFVRIIRTMREITAGDNFNVSATIESLEAVGNISVTNTMLHVGDYIRPQKLIGLRDTSSLAQISNGWHNWTDANFIDTNLSFQPCADQSYILSYDYTIHSTIRNPVGMTIGVGNSEMELVIGDAFRELPNQNRGSMSVTFTATDADLQDRPNLFVRFFRTVEASSFMGSISNVELHEVDEKSGTKIIKTNYEMQDEPLSRDSRRRARVFEITSCEMITALDNSGQYKIKAVEVID